MPAPYSISDIISFAKRSQVNSQVKISQNVMFRGGTLDEWYSRKLYLIRTAVEFAFNSVPSTPTLREVADYLYALSRPYIVSAATISITNPSGANVNVGGSASFTVSVFVSNLSPYTIQWYRNNVAIPGATSATYTLTNAQLSDSGAQFSAIATAPGVGQAVSASGTLTVTANIVGFYYFGDTEYYTALASGIDNITYNGSFNIVNGSPFIVPFPLAAANNQNQVIKYPVSQPTKTIWNNTPSNFGTIPDQAYQNRPDGSVVVIGAWKYIISRGAISLDSTHPPVTFS